MARARARAREPDNLPFIALILGGMGYYFWRSSQQKAGIPVTDPVYITLKNTVGTLIPPTSLDFDDPATPIPGTVKVPAGTSPRGIRNHNPLNIEYNAANNWLGQMGTDGRFAVFINSFFGLRAAFNLIETYHNKYGINTIRGIVSRWAPAGENHVGAYIATVERVSGIDADAPLNFKSGEQMAKVVRGMITQENGVAYQNYYSDLELIAAHAA